MFRLLTPCLLLLLLVAGCRRDSGEISRGFEFDAFVPTYNSHIEKWLLAQREATEKEIARVAAELPAAEGEARDALATLAKALETDMEKWNFRLALGPYLKVGTPAEIPADLAWENGMDQPEIGDPAATKGGVFRRHIEAFPPTIRPFGPNANNSFRGDLYDYIDIPLVNLHPETMEMIPGLAKEWATSADGRTVYFRIDPEATYSDGTPVKARDFLISCYVRISDYVVSPYSKQYFRE